jgi:chromatin remodeling complex protein RSC6
MAPKKSAKTETAAPVAEQTVAPVAEKKTSRKSKKETQPETTPAVEVDSTETTESGEKRRREVNKESIDRDFTALENKMNEEIQRLSSSEVKVKGIKLWRGLLKHVRTLHNDTNRVLKFKRDGTKKNVSSGFLKPIHISPEMAKFTGWDASKLHTRVDATKFVCKYIKDHNLYDPEDHRNIRCDDKLRALLKYDPAKAPIDPKTNKPAELTYFRLQQYLKIHFLKDSETAASSSTKTSKK